VFRFVYIGGLVAMLAAAGLFALSNANSGEATFPGANGKLAFPSVGNHVQHIVTVNPDGSDFQELTTGTVADQHPSWSRDGKKIVFGRTNSDPGDDGIWTMDADGSNKNHVSEAGAGYPAFSPDGGTIYFLGSQDNIYRVSAQGGAATPITDTGGIFYFRLSPDGSLFTYRLSGEIVTLTTNGNTLLGTGVQGYSPSFSPDGDRILYTDANGFVSTMDVNGSNVSPFSVAGDYPEYSPDMQFIVFDTEIVPANANALPQGTHPFDWIMDADGDNPHRVTDEANSEYAADWAILVATPTPTHSPAPTPSPTPTPTPTESASASPTHSPTATPISSPTSTPSAHLRGDANCDDVVDASDVIAALSEVEGVDPGAPCSDLANADCDGELDADDALSILLYAAGTPREQPQACGPIGQPTP
jgi:WD40-like Beta Propeller Repeat